MLFERGGGSASSDIEKPGWHSIIGLLLACSSGIFVGFSLILQKKGLLITTAKSIELGRPISYVKNPVWQLGMLCMALGEVSNFGAYAFSPAILGLFESNFSYATIGHICCRQVTIYMYVY
jgi:hypothetical protein